MTVKDGKPPIIFNPTKLSDQAEYISWQILSDGLLIDPSARASPEYFVDRVVLYGINANRPETLELFTLRQTKIEITVENVDVSMDGSYIRINPSISSFRISKAYGPPMNNPMSDGECKLLTDKINKFLCLDEENP